VHNDRVIVRTPRSTWTWPVVVLVAGLALAGCGAEPPSKPKPSADANQQTEVPVPTGIKLTAYGSELKFGETARVAYAPNEQRKSVLELTVISATQGSIADLSGYSLEERTRASTPYYVRVKVKNVGNGDVGRMPIPLYLVDNRTPKTLIIASSFTNSFTKCPSTPLPTTFAPQAEQSTCLVYLAPDHGTMTGVSFRGADQKGDPILWTGAAIVPTKKKAS
jgi:hypothetical protein